MVEGLSVKDPLVKTWSEDKAEVTDFTICFRDLENVLQILQRTTVSYKTQRHCRSAVSAKPHYKERLMLTRWIGVALA